MALLVKRSFVPSFADELFNNNWFSDFGVKRNGSTPAVNVTENNDGYKIEVAAPGYSKNDFHIDMDNHVLTISSEKEDKVEDTNDNYVRKEFSYCSFTRSFTLPELVKEDKIEANYKDGVLHVAIPKRDEAKAKPARVIKIA